MGWRPIVGRRHRPVAFDASGFKADRDRSQSPVHLIRRFVQRRAVKPDDMFVVVVEVPVRFEADAT